jgi:1-acyl-sn-glycerol-3-phosphate acyltransferase
MIYPKKNPLIFWAMHFYVQWLLGRHLREIKFDHIELASNRSVLLIANHYSFWDALILYTVNHRRLKKNMHVMILEESMHQYWPFRYAGAFSVKKGSKEVIESLDYAAKLLDDPQNMVLIYPQGKLYSNFVTRVNFEKGVLRVIEKAGGKFQLVFAAAFVQYFRSTKPTATVYLKTENGNFAGKSLNELQAAYQQFYDEKKLEQTEINAEQ